MKKIIPILEANKIPVDNAVLALASGGMPSGVYKPFEVQRGTGGYPGGNAKAEVADHNRGEFTYGQGPGHPRGTAGNINRGASDRPGGQSNNQSQQANGWGTVTADSSGRASGGWG
jgi:hypothetical protein